MPELRSTEITIRDSYDTNYSLEIYREIGGDIALTAAREEETGFRSVTVVLNPEDAGALLGILMKLRGEK
jgi:hypothetical protein